MNIDEYLNNLQSSLDNQISGLNQNASINTSTPQSNEERSIFCPQCGTRVTLGRANFCPNCGYAFNNSAVNSNDETEQSSETLNEGNEGIIFTNSAILAKKYKTQLVKVLKLLSDFISKNEQMGIKWHMLDVAAHQNELGEGTWMDYSEIVQRFCIDKGIATGPRLSLFIIGGNDVIPQPCEDNPAHTPSPWGDNEYSERLYADFYYCFYGQLKLDYLDYNKARCNVARLPLETGLMRTTLENDLKAYLDKSNMITEKNGIFIRKAVMTSNEDWIPASREMSRNIPTESMENEENVVLDKMYISPSILANMDEELRNKYYTSLSKANMLVFNLHGSCDPRMSGFYSNDLAFSIDMLRESNASIFNTVACWGARYIKYKREQSMLLNAMYGGGVMLYCGASVPALGKCNRYQNDTTWRIRPAAYSETFMARFAQYQCIGKMSAGELFLKAKCDYYNSSRTVEEDEYILATVLMFNLYGNPMLYTRPDAIHWLLEDIGIVKEHHIPFRKKSRETIMKGGAMLSQSNNSIIDEVRTAVDNSLSEIHKGIVEHLYKALDVKPRELFSIERYNTKDVNGNVCSGYIYNYARENNSVHTMLTVNVDEKGNIIDAIQTK